MQDTTLYQYIKVGANIEYLKNISSISIIPGTSLVEFPHLFENQPAMRYSVMEVVRAMRAIVVQAEALNLTQTLAVVRETLPMLQSMETYLSQTPQPQTATLQDHFANDLVGHAKNMALAFKADTAGMTVKSCP